MFSYYLIGFTSLLLVGSFCWFFLNQFSKYLVGKKDVIRHLCKVFDIKLFISVKIFLILCVNPFNLQAYTVSVRVKDAFSGEFVRAPKLYFNGNCYLQSQSQNSIVFNVPDNDSLFYGSVKFDDNKLDVNFECPVKVRAYTLDGRTLFGQNSYVCNSSIGVPELHGATFLVSVQSVIGAGKTFLLNKNQPSKSIIVEPEKIRSESFKIELAAEGYLSVTLNLKRGPENIDVFLNPVEPFAPNFLNHLYTDAGFNAIKSTNTISNINALESVKLIYNVKTDSVYFFHRAFASSHYEFAKKILNYTGNETDFSMTQYVNNPNRYLWPATLNYSKSANLWFFELYPFDNLDCTSIEKLNRIIAKHCFAGNSIAFCNTSSFNSNCKLQNEVSLNSLFSGQDFNAMNCGISYGYVRICESVNPNVFLPNRRDIVVLDAIPDGIPVVAGVITTVPQTPLSHLNVLCHNRSTPNAMIRSEAFIQKIKSLDGHLVKFEVTCDSFRLEPASISDAMLFWDSVNIKINKPLDYDLSFNQLLFPNSLDINSVSSVGGKAANFACLYHLAKQSNVQISTPENPFVIPFYFYAAHFKASGAYNLLQDALKDSLFLLNINYRSVVLEHIRSAIVDFPLDKSLLDSVLSITFTSEFSKYKFRSSTNAEDIKGFNGAGLYDSFGASANDPADIQQAIKCVWASLWNLSAYEERSYFNIDQRSVFMGVLAHRSFDNEVANGVMITKNLYNENHAFTINVQFGEASVVKPPHGIIPDQVLVYTASFANNSGFTIQYLLHSNLLRNRAGNVLSDSLLTELGRIGMAIKNYYFFTVYPGSSDFANFALDIEFKVEVMNGHHEIYIKQVRTYN